MIHQRRSLKAVNSLRPFALLSLIPVMIMASPIMNGRALAHFMRRTCLRINTQNAATGHGWLRSTASLVPRGGGGGGGEDIWNVTDLKEPQQNTQRRFSTEGEKETGYVTLAQPAPGSPFHYAFPVHDLEVAKQFYSKVLGCVEGRSSAKWQDYSLYGHQIVAHYVGPSYRCQDYYNPVDGDEVPVPHAGIALTEAQFHELADRVKQAGVKFIIEPHLRFKGMPGEQWTMFFKDPSGNNLEFKAMRYKDNLFAKYHVEDG